LIKSLEDVKAFLEPIGNDDQKVAENKDGVLQLLETLEGLLSVSILRWKKFHGILLTISV